MIRRFLDSISQSRPRSTAIDHYNGWAFHLYPLLHARLSGSKDLLDTYGPRLAAYLDGYAGTFGGDGAPMHQGRSLIYRFAAAAPLWAGALTGHTRLTPGATRRLASGTLRYFVDGGAVAANGLLSLGWFGPYDPMVQAYSRPASPYWASKGFLGLLLPADHPMWTAVAEPGPAETAAAAVPLPRPGWLIQSTAADGIVRLHNHGSDDQPRDRVLPDSPLYARLAYSTATGPDGLRLTSALENISGFTAAESHGLPSGTALGSMAAVPVLTGSTGTEATLFVSAARLARAAPRPFRELHVRVDGNRIRVRRPDGDEDEAVLAPGDVTVTTVRPGM